MFEQLPVVVAVAPRRNDLRRRLEVEHPLLGAGVRVQPPGRPDRQHEVVAGAVAERAEDRVADAAALVDVQHLVGDPVAIERPGGHRLGRADDAEDHVVVEVQRDPSRDRVASRRHRTGLRQPMAMEPVVGGLDGDPADRLDLVGLRRRRDVIEDRAASGEALHPEQLLGVEAAVGGAVLRVTLRRDAAVGDVVHGRRASWVRRQSSGAPRRGVSSRAMSQRVPDDEFRRVLTGEDPGLGSLPKRGQALPGLAALQAVPVPIRGYRRRGVSTRRLRSLSGQSGDLLELHQGLPQEGADRSGDPGQPPLRRRARFDGDRRGHATSRVSQLPRRVLPHRLGGHPRPRRARRQAGRRRDHRAVLRRRSRVRAMRTPPIEAATELVARVGRPDASPRGRYPIGAGVHTGEAYVGTTGPAGAVDDFTALGDVVNTTARLASSAAAGEILVTRRGSRCRRVRAWTGSSGATWRSAAATSPSMSS